MFSWARGTSRVTKGETAAAEVENGRGKATGHQFPSMVNLAGEHRHLWPPGAWRADSLR